MVNITNLRNIAQRLILENGRDVTLIRQDQSNPIDPAKPWRANLDTDDISLVVKAVNANFKNEDIDGTLVRRGDKLFLIAAKTIEETVVFSEISDVEKYDELLDGITLWKIVSVDTVAPGDSNILYKVQVRA